MKIIKSISAVVFAALLLFPLCRAAETAAISDAGSTLQLSHGGGTNLIIENDVAREAISKALLKDGVVFEGKIGDDTIQNPWLLPNSIIGDNKKSLPAASFFKANADILSSEYSINKLKEYWIMTDIVFSDSAKRIKSFTEKMGPISYVFFDGEGKENAKEILAMPHDGYYAALITALLGDNSVNLVGKDRRVDLEEILSNDKKDTMLLIVPTRDAADGLKNKGYHAVVFEGNIPTATRAEGENEIPGTIDILSITALKEVEAMAQKAAKSAEALKKEVVEETQKITKGKKQS